MDGARAVADPVRREILDLLHAAPRPAGEIAERFAISRPAVSKHLRVLIECRAVEVTVIGRRRIYGLRTAPLAELAAYLDGLLRPPLAHRLDALATEVARTRRERRSAANLSGPNDDSGQTRRKRA